MQDPQTGTVLALVAHPDDAEFLCGGTLALLAQRGWEIHVATSTPGDLGSADLAPDEIAAVRRAEGAAAAAVIKGDYHCLELRDLRVVYGEDGLRRFHFPAPQGSTRSGPDPQPLLLHDRPRGNL